MINRLSELKNKKVLIIGDIILDRYINVSPRKISDEAPLLIFNYNSEYYSLGGCTNVAKYISSFEIMVDLVGVIGNDDNSNIIIDLLMKNNINTEFVIRDNIITTTKTRLFSNDNKQVLRVDKEENSFDFKNLIVEKINELNNNYDLIIISDYNKGVITPTTFKKIINFAENIPVICDPKNFDIDFNNLYLLKPNKKEMNSLIKDFNDEKIIEYKNKNNIKNIVLTLGEEGMVIFDDNNIKHNIKALKNQVFDVTGAGDSVLSYLALGILLKMDFIDTCKLANYSASIKVTKFGTELVKLEEIINYFNNKIISRKDIKEFCNILHKNKKIVFTNGCFDIIHSGHIYNLKTAKSKGDILILGLNSDYSIKKIKGDKRPIFNEKERLDILTSLEFVDYIVVFDEETPINLINDIKPDILVKGADYKDKFIVGKKEVEEYGGKVVLIDLVQGESTTNIIKRIKEDNSE
ncbi:MAG: D-glycero-beta-D-manno-heptose 1-phosphate adenylyltransferase [Bacilli bacterium]